MHHFEVEPYSGEVWRFVEAQHKNSTMKLVDSEAEQETLERLLDETKPPVPKSCSHLHYLLFTPFRYEAIRSTRFRRVGQPEGVFYCAESIETAAAEVAFYRLLFFLESPDTDIPVEPFEMTAFSVSVQTDRAWDITRDCSGLYTDPQNYDACHLLVDNAIAAGAELIRYRSVRRHDGKNLAILSCAAFVSVAPINNEGWKFRLTKDRVTVRKSFGAGSFEFLRSDFAVDRRVAASD